jgi:transposase
VHSYYTRTVADLPWSDVTVTLQVQTRRFECPVVACARKIFCERLTPFVAVYGRRTHRARASLEHIGLALAGRAGAWAAATQRTPVSRTTLLRLVRALPCPPVADLTVVGVDDFARRKGRTYGTIVCDLVRQRPVDLRPERSADSWAAWLALHPTVDVVSRDRGHPYGECGLKMNLAAVGTTSCRCLRWSVRSRPTTTEGESGRDVQFGRRSVP